MPFHTTNKQPQFPEPGGHCSMGHPREGSTQTGRDAVPSGPDFFGKMACSTPVLLLPRSLL